MIEFVNITFYLKGSFFDSYQNGDIQSEHYLVLK